MEFFPILSNLPYDLTNFICPFFFQMILMKLSLRWPSYEATFIETTFKLSLNCFCASACLIGKLLVNFLLIMYVSWKLVYYETMRGFFTACTSFLYVLLTLLL